MSLHDFTIFYTVEWYHLEAVHSPQSPRRALRGHGKTGRGAAEPQRCAARFEEPPREGAGRIPGGFQLHPGLNFLRLKDRPDGITMNISWGIYWELLEYNMISCHTNYPTIWDGCVWKLGRAPFPWLFFHEENDQKLMDFGVPYFKTSQNNWQSITLWLFNIGKMAYL